MKIKDLTLREKICQTVIINNPESHFEKFGGYKKFFEKYPVGGIFLGGSIVGGHMPGTDEMFELVDEWNNEMKVPTIFCCDYENGEDEPHQMALGATHDKELAYESGRVRAKGLKRQGKHWMFNPVVDMVMSEVAPINIRAIGDSPEVASEMIVEMIKGANSENVLSTAKHFPGMGRELMDTHLTKVDVMLSKEEWDSTYRVIYKKLIDNGLMSVMSAHMSLPCYQKERMENGYPPVCTVSKELITDLLKDDLGFQGVVVTDALTMGGTAGNSVEFAVEAFKAGHDMLLWPPLEYVDVLEEKILNGEISEERLDDAVERVFRIKEFVKAGKRDCEIGDDSNVAKKIAEKSITLMNNFNGVIPLDKEKIKKMLLVTPAKDDVSYKKLLYLKEIFESLGIEVIHCKDLWIPELKNNEKEVDFTLFACFEGPSTVPGPILINGENGASIWAAQTADVNKTIVASFGSPFLYSEYFKCFPTYVNVYSPEKVSCEAFVKAIFGEIECEGKSPVKV